MCLSPVEYHVCPRVKIRGLYLGKLQLCLPPQLILHLLWSRHGCQGLECDLLHPTKRWRFMASLAEPSRLATKWV